MTTHMHTRDEQVANTSILICFACVCQGSLVLLADSGGRGTKPKLAFDVGTIRWSGEERIR